MRILLSIILLLSTCLLVASETVLRTNVTFAQGYMDDWRLEKKLSGKVGTVFELNAKFKIDTVNIQ